MNNKIKKGSILITDCEKSYRNYTKNNNLKLKQIKDRNGDKLYHIQNINNYHSGLKEWIRRFHGVSTKHLDNYLNFFKIMKVLKKDVFDSCITINNSIKISEINNKELSFC